MSVTRKLWIGLFVLIILAPLGLIIPARFGAGSAWGEWSSEEIKRLIGYVPPGMPRLSGLWKAPMPNYTMKGQASAPLHTLSLSYILSAVVGVVIITAITILIGKALAGKDDR